MIINLVGGGGALSQFPKFTYTGQFQLIDDGKTSGKRNWRIRFLTSGVLTFQKLKTPIDVFLVGGGGGNGNTQKHSDKSGSGGGGYTCTAKGIVADNNTEYEIIIGDGGTMPESASASAVRGGDTIAFSVTAKGGYSGSKNSGGHGGSGGADAVGNVRATDGADGQDSSSSEGKPGYGQKNPNNPEYPIYSGSTREFGEETGALYASGGAQGSGDGAPNTGDGGGGTDVAGTATSGGSGIVVIRNAR